MSTTMQPSPRSVEIANGDAERREDDDVLRGDTCVIEDRLAVGIVFGRENLDTHLAEPPVDVRVVDDLADKQDAAIGELSSGLVGVLDRSLNAVAEPEFAGKPDRNAPDRQRVIARTEKVDQGTIVIGGERRFDLAFEPESLPKIGRALLRRRHVLESSSPLQPAVSR